ncbi:hypothetical protein HNP46_001608 [Pseudomonas nitritireducens]|uniref:Uncharacterized protein n=1 Tax=Pseudomonas nitroreducens TaxID=46680 RepID=A0A7W7KI43_PSENT|nr:hypothetical protein [Pseudomonas nitritireducens]MBB4862764.1 hypothetical protein [Pseudomonas nitritireducens]
MSFISLKVRAAFIVHGYDEQNREVIEQVSDPDFVEKLVRIERIQSISEKYVLVTAGEGRLAYWEYAEEFAALKARLKAAGLLV